MWSVLHMSSIVERMIVVQLARRPHLGFIEIDGWTAAEPTTCTG